MTAEKTPTTLTARITGHLPLVEKILIATLLVGAILTALEIDSTVTKGSLLALGVTFFLFAYRPIDIPGQEEVPMGLSEMLGLMIVPKVLWISCAISTVGIAFFIFDLGNPGYMNMLMIGGFSIGTASLILVILLNSGVKHINLVMPILLRAVPIFLVDCYLLFG